MAVKSFGVEAPIIREGDNIVNIVVDSVLEATAKDYSQMAFGGAGHELGYHLNYKNDIIGITESVVARAMGQYITVDDIARDIDKKYGKGATICVVAPIYSRNRFSMILKGVARSAKMIHFIFPEFDDVGNPRGTNPFTGVNIEKYYKEICESEGCECTINEEWSYEKYPVLDCILHAGAKIYPKKQAFYYLDDICSDKSPDWGVLGTNKATEEKLKLFPSKIVANKVCEDVKAEIKKRTGKDVLVCVYGDGCFKDPVGGIWEFADPVTMPGYTNPEIFESTPNEIKIKAFADDKFGGLSGESLNEAVKEEIKNKDKNLVGNMASQGTTPRKIRDLVASLMDLTSGSGDKGTPIVVVQGYFDNYATK